MSDQLRIGLIGCGRAAERLWLPAFRAVREVRLAAVVDPRSERRDLIARAVPSCIKLETPEQLFAGGGVDAAIVATPAETHFALAYNGLRAGVPILVEKPLASTVAQALELGELRESAASALMVGFNRRWWSPIRRLRERLKKRGPASAKAELVFVTEAGKWGAVAGIPDLLDDLASHQFDLLRFVLGHEIESVAAHQAVEKDIRMQVCLTDGSVAQCRVAHRGLAEESVRLSAGPLHAWIHAKSDRVTPAGGSARLALDLGNRVWRRLSRRSSSLLRSFERELREFSAIVRGHADETPGVADGIAAARAVAAARRSLSSGGAPVAP